MHALSSCFRLLAGLVLAAACAGALSGCAAAGPRAAEPGRRTGAGTLVVTVTGFENSEGQALLNLFLGPAGFPGDPQQAFRAERLAIREGRVQFTFQKVPAGAFAISAFHDENMNMELDTGFLDIPTEKWGVSRDAGGFLGPPSYDSAMLTLGVGELLEVVFPIG